MRVYEQTLEYDGFSNLSERSGENWGVGISFTESYVNGRIQSTEVVYDAAGNVVSQPIDSMPEGNGTSTYDSAGRRVKYFDQRFGLRLKANLMMETRFRHYSESTAICHNI